MSLDKLFPLILNYSDVYFNDEGESWNNFEEPIISLFVKKLLYLTDKGIAAESNITEQL